jgi:hypothetical protein
MDTPITPDFDDDENEDLPESDNEAKNEGDLNQFGVPEFISVDNGTEYRAPTPSPKGYRPSMKGSVERQFSNLVNQLRAKF